MTELSASRPLRAEPTPLTGRWATVGRIARADGSVPWMHGYTGAACAVTEPGSSVATIYVTGRDAENRSLIGRGRCDLAAPAPRLMVEPEACFGLGGLGAFDENGVSYPCLVDTGDGLRLYYTGWMPTVLTPFQNHIGLARAAVDGRFERVSRAPILPRTDADHLSMGSCFVMAEERPAGRLWHMWYTAFLGWGQGEGQPKHRYVIKYASSGDGISWDRDDVICISAVHADEHSISRPSVIRWDGNWHMWFCHRGDRYRLGYAVSGDGRRWDRVDDHMRIGPLSDWDGEEQAYPHVFEKGGRLWMLYCGNGYGRDGLGLARFEPDV